MTDSRRISPTAHAAGYLWYRNGLSDPALVSPQGRRLHYLLRPPLALAGRLGGLSLDALMLARHRGIDALLAEAVDAGRIGQVVEIASGLSARGLRFTRRYPDRLRYVDTDLPHLARLKSELLGGTRPRNLSIHGLDALADAGPESLEALAGQFDPDLGTAVITEGLMTYFDPDQAAGMWRRIAGFLRRFPRGLYLSDLYLQPDYRGASSGLMRQILGRFVKGRMHVHFASADEAVHRMKQAGFDDAYSRATAEIDETRALAARPGGDRVRILAAQTGPA